MRVLVDDALMPAISSPRRDRSVRYRRRAREFAGALGSMSRSQIEHGPLPSIGLPQVNIIGAITPDGC